MATKQLEQNLTNAKARLREAIGAIDRSMGHKDCKPHVAALLASADDHATRAVGFIARAFLSI